MTKSIDLAVIENVCKILGELTSGYKITMMFKALNFNDADIIQFGKPVSTKWKRLRDEIIYECTNQHSARPFFQIIEYIMKPIDFVDFPAAWHENRKAINSKLMFYGFELTDYGKIIQTTAVESVADAQKRLQSFQNKLDMYEIHQNVLQFCNSATKNCFKIIIFMPFWKLVKVCFREYVKYRNWNLMERL